MYGYACRCVWGPAGTGGTLDIDVHCCKWRLLDVERRFSVGWLPGLVLAFSWSWGAVSDRRPSAVLRQFVIMGRGFHVALLSLATVGVFPTVWRRRGIQGLTVASTWPWFPLGAAIGFDRRSVLTRIAISVKLATVIGGLENHANLQSTLNGSYWEIWGGMRVL